MKPIAQRHSRRPFSVPRTVSRPVRVFLRRSIPRIVSTFPGVQRIILFGSHAVGRSTRDSDVDLLIIMPTTWRWSERIRRVQALFPERPVPLDVIVRTPREIRQRLTSYFCPFTREIVQRGRVLYDTASRRS